MNWAAAVSRGPLARVDGFHGTVLAASAGAVYVAPAAGDLLVVHDAAHAHTPTSIRVARACLAGVRPGVPAAGRAGHLRVGDLVVDVRHAPVWSPPAPLRHAALRPGWWRSLPPPDPRLSAAAGEVLRGARAGDAGPGLLALVGLGAGSTPAGDDALVGLLAVLHRATPPPDADPLLAALLRGLPPLLHRTTPVSAHYLRLALRGDLAEPIVTLVDDLAAGSDAVPTHLDTVLRTGATSGRDALAGVVAALHALADRAAGRKDAA